jgi:hypothetical protein
MENQCAARSTNHCPHILIGGHVPPLLGPSPNGGAPSPRAHADETSMIGPLMDERGSRMSDSLILPLPFELNTEN